MVIRLVAARQMPRTGARVPPPPPPPRQSRSCPPERSRRSTVLLQSAHGESMPSCPRRNLYGPTMTARPSRPVKCVARPELKYLPRSQLALEGTRGWKEVRSSAPRERRQLTGVRTFGPEHLPRTPAPPITTIPLTVKAFRLVFILIVKVISVRCRLAFGL